MANEREKLTDNQLLMALACCTDFGRPACNVCPLRKENDCVNTMLVQALDRMNRLCAEKAEGQKDGNC